MSENLNSTQIVTERHIGNTTYVVKSHIDDSSKTIILNAIRKLIQEAAATAD